MVHSFVEFQLEMLRHVYASMVRVPKFQENTPLFPRRRHYYQTGLYNIRNTGRQLRAFSAHRCTQTYKSTR